VAGVRLLLLLGLLAAGLRGQQQPDRQLQEAGVCARCHVISVIEWGISKHWKAGTNCVACHGASQGHVIDERNNVKPDRLPHGEAIAGLCATCHQAGCPKSKRKDGCAECHHFHALVNPQSQPAPAPKAAAAPPPAARRDPAEGLPKTYRVPGVGIEMVLVRGGEVEIGSDTMANAQPVHSVLVAPFYLGVMEVTEAQWNAVMGRPVASVAAARLPASNISWKEAQAFAARLNVMASGGGFRLPTEAEWEFAARAGDTADPVFQRPVPRPAGQGAANPLGLFDLAGNVWEWCSSLGRAYPYDASDGREAADAAGLRVLRGGSYNDPPGWVSPATRHLERPDRRMPWYGLRIARSVVR
jgi:formylglycine-generating enzyme required for sulfatase activity